MTSRVEETKKLNKQLSKAASDGKTEDVLALLKQLKQVVDPTEELIRVCRATHIGDQDWCGRWQTAHARGRTHL